MALMKNALRVLDVASPGSVLFAYYDLSKRQPKRDFFVKAFGKNPGYSMNRNGNFEFLMEQGLVPDYMKKLQGGSFDHVHFHALKPGISSNGLAETFNEIRRVMTKGGLLFFSMDDSCDAYGNEGAVLAIPLAIGSIREGFRIEFSHASPGVPSMGRFEEVKAAHGQDHAGEGALEAMGLFDSKLEQGVPRNAQEVREFFKLFSATTYQSCYFAIAKKE